jgi:hypothetical protein
MEEMEGGRKTAALVAIQGRGARIPRIHKSTSGNAVLSNLTFPSVTLDNACNHLASRLPIKNI